MMGFIAMCHDKLTIAESDHQPTRNQRKLSLAWVLFLGSPNIAVIELFLAADLLQGSASNSTSDVTERLETYTEVAIRAKLD